VTAGSKNVAPTSDGVASVRIPFMPLPSSNS
jgi:hypothetical protein